MLLCTTQLLNLSTHTTASSQPKDLVASASESVSRMKTEVVSNGERAVSEESRCRLRFVDLSFEGKDMTFKNSELDNGRFPHGGYKGSKKHPLSVYSFDKGRDYHRQLRDDLDRLEEEDVIGGVRGSPTWSLVAHRWPTHSGESPLLSHGFLSPSKIEVTNGSGRLGKEPAKRARVSSSPPVVSNGVMYYRPERLHQYLYATDLMADVESEEMLRYGRPTRTTLLRARQKVGCPSSNAYEIRRQSDQRTDDIRNGCLFSNPKELVQPQGEVDGQSFHSFLTGARYNRAHCLDSRSLSQHGVYMPRHNPLGCFVVGHLEEAALQPDSPRSDTAGESSNRPPPPPEPRRPTTAPVGLRKPLKTSSLAIPTPKPRHAWGQTTPAGRGARAEKRKGDNDGISPAVEEHRVRPPKFGLKTGRVPLPMLRDVPPRVEPRLPSVHGMSLVNPRQTKEAAAEAAVLNANQPHFSPTPTPAPTARADNLSVPPDTLQSESEQATDKPVPESEQVEGHVQESEQEGDIPENESKPESAQREGYSPTGMPSMDPDGAGNVEVTQDEEGEYVGDAEREADRNGDTGEGEESSPQAESRERTREEENEEESQEQQDRSGVAAVAGGGGGGEEEESEAGEREGEREEDEGVTEARDGETGETGKEEEDRTPLSTTTLSGQAPQQPDVNEADLHTPNDVTGDTSQKEGQEPTRQEEDVRTEGGDSSGTAPASSPSSPQETDGRKEGDDVKFFLTEEGRGDVTSANDVTRPPAAEGKQLEDDQASTTSSRKSKGKRTVTFADVDADESQHGGSAEKPPNPVHNASQNEAKSDLDTDLEGPEQGQGDSEPLKVIVTHIEKQ